MIGRFSSKARPSSISRFFSEEVKQRMQLTLRSPYKTFMKNFEGFSRIVGQTTEGALVIQSKQPPAAYILLPGTLKVQLVEERKDTTGEYVHSGGFAVIHPNNTVDINLIEAFDKKDVQFNKVAESEATGNANSASGKYVEQIKKEAKKGYARLA